MTKSAIRTVAIPRDSLVARAFVRVDYADAYETALPDELTVDVDAFARRFLAAAPRWARQLMAIRERAVRFVGLKRITARRQPNPAAMMFQPGAVAGIFRVFAHTADEILVGEDDRHLDFRVSFLLRTEPSGRVAVVTTVVQYHNRLGRAYFAPVRLFHRRIVRAMLRETTDRFAREERRPRERVPPQ